LKTAFKTYLLRSGFAFIVLFAITLPFPLYSFRTPGMYLQGLFESLNHWSGVYLFGITTEFNAGVESDTTGFYLHVFHLLFVAGVAACAWTFIARNDDKQQKVRYWFHVSASYILAFFLLKYGLDKIFKAQFYLPEPNTLYTPLGFLSKDILFWSTLGSSYSYSFFSGLLEVIPALLLFSRRTRMLGGCIALGVMLHVWMINFSFDISVKILSSYLLLLTIIVIAPYSRNLYRFFISEKVAPEIPEVALVNTVKAVKMRALKALVILLMIFECLFMYVQNGQFNDDLAPRPKFHGAYHIVHAETQGDAQSHYFGPISKIKRLFIHRRGYLILQFSDDSMQDYPLALNPSANLIYVRTPQGPFAITILKKGKNSFDFQWKEANGFFTIHAQKQNLQSLPLLQNDFIWSTDEYAQK